MSGQLVVTVASGVGGERLNPFVTLTFEHDVVQLDPAQARDVAMNLLESAEASESDAMLLAFLTKNVGIEVEHAARLLPAFRAMRETRRLER